MKSIFPFIFFVTVLLTLIGLGHFIVYKSILAVFNITNIRILTYIRGFFIVGSLSFIVSTLVTQTTYSKIGALLYEGSAIWLGTFYFLFLASVIILIIFSINQLVGGQLFIPQVLGLFLLIIALGASVYGLIHSYQVAVTKYEVSIKNLPTAWQNKKIILFSDTHFGNIRNVGFAKKLVHQINLQNPDIVIIAGDYYDGPKTNHLEIANTLSDLHAPMGIYFAPGNHEEYGEINLFNESLKASGVVVLANNFVNIDGLAIVGIDYQTGSNGMLITEILNSLNLPKDQPKILIKHAPNQLESVSNFGFDLVLSGHVHKGQVWPGPWLSRKMFKEFFYGLNYFNVMPVITSSGAGTWGPPQRVGTKSEIVSINLKSPL